MDEEEEVLARSGVKWESGKNYIFGRGTAIEVSSKFSSTWEGSCEDHTMDGNRSVQTRLKQVWAVI